MHNMQGLSQCKVGMKRPSEVICQAMITSQAAHEICVMLQGMLRSIVVGQYYKDLKNESYDTSFAVYHRRFSTNTNPRWPLAQPMRVLGHNGAHCTTESA